MSFDESLLDEYTNGVKALSAAEKSALHDWVERIGAKYKTVGRLRIDSLPTAEEQAKVISADIIKSFNGCQAPKPADMFELPFVPSIYVGVGGNVYDCSFGGSGFYGPGGPYQMFAGIDCSVALAKMKFDKEFLESRDVQGLNDAEKKILREWVNTFKNKKEYVIVGRTGQDFD